MPNLSESDNLIKALCLNCRSRHTNHDILAQHIETSDDTDMVYWSQTSQIIKCRGCDAVRFRVEEFDDETRETGIRIYPEYDFGYRALNRQLADTPVIGTIYRETVVAYN